MKICLVHDDFTQDGGAESLFATIASVWPDAPVYTSLVNWQKLPQSIDKSRLKTSFLQKIPFAGKFFKVFLPLYPLAIENFNFDGFDVVISSTTRFAKAIVTKPKTIHISYVNSIPRFLWNEQIRESYLPSSIQQMATPLFKWLKRWDKVAASRVDYYIANSQNVAASIKKFYGYDAKVICPFADINFFRPPKIHNWKLKGQSYFLVVSRLVKWKKIDIAIETSGLRNFNLKIVGEGPDKKRLLKLAKVKNAKVEFFGKVTRKELRALYQNARALIVTQEEDFGIAMVEAQACGIPVIAYGRGGQNEIIKEKETGIFFKSQSPQSLKDAIIAFSGLKWSSLASRNNSLKFSKARFVSELKNQVKIYAPGT